MCVNCIRTQVDITEGVQKQVTLLWCKNCERYLQPPKHWVSAEPESKELLAFCLKRIKGLQKVKLVDAGFVWTEPHSMRLKAKLTVQGEVLNGAILQQSFIVEFVIERHMCVQCNRASANPDSWIACVQVRQHVAHKRTFFFLEQLVLKHGQDAACLNVKDIHEGVDFYFGNRAHGLKFVDFLSSVVPARHRSDKQLVSHDVHTSNYNYKYTFSTEIAPVCREDLVCLPRATAHAHGGVGPLVLCTKVTSALTFTDPATLRSVAVDADKYWRAPFRAVMSARQLVEYVVLDVELAGGRGGGARGGALGDGRWAAADVTVARAADLGANDRTCTVRTHLGHLLHPGDHALGYDVANAVLSSADLEAAVDRGYVLPEVILVRKSYEEKRRRRRAKGGGAAARPWRLKRMDVEYGADDFDPAAGGGRQRAGAAAPAEALAADMERFLEELEEDPELRARVALYRDPEGAAAAAAAAAARGEETDGSEGAPEVPLEELLEDLAAMQLDGGDAGGGGGGAMAD
jgi:nonsense-mediated mRNA decay protein 3